MNQKYFLIAFTSICFVDVLSVLLRLEPIRYVSKPLIIISLMAYYIAATPKKDHLYSIALLCCFIGDVFLLFKGNQNFMFGLLAFLLGHVFYMVILKRNVKETNTGKLIKAVIPFGIIFIVLMTILYKHLDQMLFPVIIYGLTICTMGTMALYNYLVKKKDAHLFFVLGASFFILSDSLIAVNKFLVSKHFFSVAVMLTYCLAQYLICRAILTNETAT